ncbi:MAG TPA: VOC family protein [Mycobacteriales bacterium]|jgi:predicted enzyme related to lactoylglutathione lyase|nr:VOC family protein [Mycobacteriales bacterium]
MSTPSPARLTMVNIDCPDPRALVAFYGRLLGWDVAHDEDEYGMITQGGTAIGFGRVDPYAAPQWPDAAGGKQFHLDLAVDDIPAAERLAIDLGAKVPEHQPGGTWRVLLDPAGHPFCLTGG